MFYFVLSLHILLCVVLVGLVLLQQGKGASMGVALGGGSNSVFGSAGATGMLVKVTTSLAIVFMITSIYLAKTYMEVSAEGVVTVDPLKGSVFKDFEAAPAEPVSPKVEAPVAPAPLPNENSAAKQ